MADHHVQTSPRTQLIEEQFNSLDFAHRVRIAAHTLITKAIDDKHDIGMRVITQDQDGEKAMFEITVTLKEVE